MPMRPVRCQECGAHVLVRKSSLQQTSVQWDEDALSSCHQRLGFPASPAEPVFRDCPRLRESIRCAVESGELPVLEPSSS
ncbi:ferredoxin [Nocardia sp. CA-135398]|uniref:ferredoxin n=1 Tax=Nocardia sp. CA-135398 TaxID=3239977 RepID=UPI003D969B4C